MGTYVDVCICVASHFDSSMDKCWGARLNAGVRKRSTFSYLSSFSTEEFQLLLLSVISESGSTNGHDRSGYRLSLVFRLSMGQQVQVLHEHSSFRLYVLVKELKRWPSGSLRDPWAV